MKWLTSLLTALVISAPLTTSAEPPVAPTEDMVPSTNDTQPAKVPAVEAADVGLSPTAVALAVLKRFSHEPGVLRVEDTIPADVGDELTRRGHKVVWWPSRHWLVGSVSCVKNELDKGLMKGGSDHRRGAYVLGW